MASQDALLGRLRGVVFRGELQDVALRDARGVPDPVAVAHRGLVGPSAVIAGVGSTLAWDP